VTVVAKVATATKPDAVAMNFLIDIHTPLCDRNCFSNRTWRWVWCAPKEPDVFRISNVDPLLKEAL